LLSDQQQLTYRTDLLLQALEFLQKLKAEIKANYATPVQIPDEDYKKAAAEMTTEKVRLGLQDIVKVEPPKSLSLKDLVEGK
jgi:hypothetical protein